MWRGERAGRGEGLDGGARLPAEDLDPTAPHGGPLGIGAGGSLEEVGCGAELALDERGACAGVDERCGARDVASGGRVGNGAGADTRHHSDRGICEACHADQSDLRKGEDAFGETAGQGTPLEASGRPRRRGGVTQAADGSGDHVNTGAAADLGRADHVALSNWG